MPRPWRPAGGNWTTLERYARDWRIRGAAALRGRLRLDARTAEPSRGRRSRATLVEGSTYSRERRRPARGRLSTRIDVGRRRGTTTSRWRTSGSCAPNVRGHGVDTRLRDETSPQDARSGRGLMLVRSAGKPFVVRRAGHRYCVATRPAVAGTGTGRHRPGQWLKRQQSAGLSGMRILLAAVLAALVVAPCGARAAADLPLPVDGVRATQGSGGVKIVFGPKAKRLYKKIAGRKVTVGVQDRAPRTDGPVLRRDAGGGGEGLSRRSSWRRSSASRCGWASAPAGSTRAGSQARRTKKLKNGGEQVRHRGRPRSCRSTSRARSSSTRARLAIVARRRHRRCSRRPRGRRTTGRRRTRSREAGRRGRARRARRARTARRPRDRIGLYSDGVAHAAVVAVAKSGRRVFIEVDGDALKTNLTTVLFSD